MLLISDYKKIRKARKDSLLDSNKFFQEYSNLISKIAFGCSFSSEEYKFKDKNNQGSLKALKTIINDFKIRDIRLGIRWNMAMDENEKFNFRYYKPIFDYILKQNVRICLNVGPIKVFRWPEQHVPDFVLNKLDKLPAKGARIGKEDEISKYAFEFLDNLFSYLKKTYPPKQLDRITSIQPENESFHEFGIYRWTFSPDYLDKCVQIIRKFFPNQRIMLNSSECSDYKAILKFVEEIGLDFQKFIVGVNYYYKSPAQQKNILLKPFDGITLSNLQGSSCKDLRALSKTKGFQIEISEAQTEGWGPLVTTPGNSVEEFRFMLFRVCREILNLEAEKSTIRIWGIENLVANYLQNKLNQDQERIIDIVSQVNS